MYQANRSYADGSLSHLQGAAAQHASSYMSRTNIEDTLRQRAEQARQQGIAAAAPHGRSGPCVSSSWSSQPPSQIPREDIPGQSLRQHLNAEIPAGRHGQARLPPTRRIEEHMATASPSEASSTARSSPSYSSSATGIASQATAQAGQPPSPAFLLKVPSSTPDDDAPSLKEQPFQFLAGSRYGDAAPPNSLPRSKSPSYGQEQPRRASKSSVGQEHLQQGYGPQSSHQQAQQLRPPQQQQQQQQAPHGSPSSQTRQQAPHGSPSSQARQQAPHGSPCSTSSSQQQQQQRPSPRQQAPVGSPSDQSRHQSGQLQPPAQQQQQQQHAPPPSPGSQTRQEDIVHYLRQNNEHLIGDKRKLEKRVVDLEKRCLDLENRKKQYKQLYEQVINERQSMTGGNMEITNLHQQLSAISLLKDALNQENLDLNRRLEEAERAKGQEEAERSKQATCVICMDNLANIVCIPCKHLAICIDCGRQAELAECPICRSRVEQKMQIFTP
eukprot:TRINITY_DN2170_c2_g1_i1.p1 TRINITY_DN2170_c2_g1~~TRINITY_DN2170_c2_g1_i1.p1  ORF type:complete len:546 (+),score=117.72 TRINITY_DN2170_c2_g1_i1:148-1638(+)